MKHAWRALSQLFSVLPKDARPFYLFYSVFTALLAILDTAALGLIVVTVSSLVSNDPINLPIIGELPDGATAWIVVAVATLFILKGVLALFLHWKATRRFAKYELMLGDKIFSNYIHASWETRSQVSTAELTRMVDSSVGNAIRGFLLPLSQIPGNALTFLAALTILVVSAPVTAAVALVYLSLVLGIMSWSITKKTREAGRISRNYTFRVATIMTEMIDALKEVTLRNKLFEAGDMISRNRAISTRARANLAFITVVPRYVFEAALIGGFLVVGGTAYLFGGSAEAMFAISLFAATGFRMIPSMNAVQSSLTAASSNEIYVADVIRELSARSDDPTTKIRDTQALVEKPRELQLQNISFSYDQNAPNVLKNLSLTIPFGTRLAVVGPSGAGKSTLIDILLGLSIPTSGQLAIDGQPLTSVLAQWRKRVGYVPQRVALFDGTIGQNVALTWEDQYDADRVEEALKHSHMSELLQRENGINERIGERGASISGGQQQRLGIARALYSNPLVMVMDEATSSLDTATERRIVESLDRFSGEITFITVAHRLATIRHYDQICYLEDGHILGQGSFDEVIDQVPAFKVQAQLAGLID